MEQFFVAFEYDTDQILPERLLRFFSLDMRFHGDAFLARIVKRSTLLIGTQMEVLLWPGPGHEVRIFACLLVLLHFCGSSLFGTPSNIFNAMQSARRHFDEKSLSFRELQTNRRAKKVRTETAIQLLRWSTSRVVYFEVLMAIGSIVSAIVAPSFSSIFYSLILISGCVHDFAIYQEWLVLNSYQVSFFAYFRYSLFLMIMLISDVQAHPSQALMHVSGTLFGSLLPVETWLRMLFCCCALSIHLYSLAFVENLTPLSCFERASPYIVILVVILAIDKMFHAVIVASMETDHTSRMLKSFRHVVRGLADGDVLLDSSFNIHGDSSRLEQILATREKVMGKSFLDFLKEGEQDKFLHFIQNTSTKEGEIEKQMVRCTRVTLTTMPEKVAELRGSVGVDVFHVPIPDNSSDAGVFSFHLLAIREDVETRVLPECSPIQGTYVDGRLQRSGDLDQHTASSASDMNTSGTDIIESYEELKEITLLLNANSELFDAEGAKGFEGFAEPGIFAEID